MRLLHLTLRNDLDATSTASRVGMTAQRSGRWSVLTQAEAARRDGFVVWTLLDQADRTRKRTTPAEGGLPDLRHAMSDEAESTFNASIAWLRQGRGRRGKWQARRS